MPVLQASMLGKLYNGTAALRNLNLSIDKGEIFCLLGQNGAGKTTTINLFLGFTDATRRNELQMPTPFDALVYASHPNFKGLPENVLNNRKLLINTMTKFGFNVDPVEWWHFNYIGNSEFDLLDLPHEEIEKYISNK
jgi:energy-coupling factor transporter ATP-binding protein EcfA2